MLVPCMSVGVSLPCSHVHGFTAWNGPEFVVYGHNALRGLQLRDTSVGLDTGCCYGGRLSAYVLPDQRVVSVPARRMYSKPTKLVPGAVDGEGSAVSQGVCACMVEARLLMTCCCCSVWQLAFTPRS